MKLTQSKYGGSRWNAQSIELIPYEIDSREQKQNLTEIAELFYDLACQFSKRKDHVTSAEPNLSELKRSSGNE